MVDNNLINTKQTKQLNSEDKVLDQIANEMATSNMEVFNKYFNNNGLEISLPQVSRLLAVSNVFFLDIILEFSTPTTINKDYKPITLSDSKIDIVNMLADMLRLFINKKETKNYKPLKK